MKTLINIHQIKLAILCTCLNPGSPSKKISQVLSNETDFRQNWFPLSILMGLIDRWPNWKSRWYFTGKIFPWNYVNVETWMMIIQSKWAFDSRFASFFHFAEIIKWKINNLYQSNLECYEIGLWTFLQEIIWSNFSIYSQICVRI